VEVTRGRGRYDRLAKGREISDQQVLRGGRRKKDERGQEVREKGGDMYVHSHEEKGKTRLTVFSLHHNGEGRRSTSESTTDFDKRGNGFTRGGRIPCSIELPEGKRGKGD